MAKDYNWAMRFVISCRIGCQGRMDRHFDRISEYRSNGKVLELVKMLWWPGLISRLAIGWQVVRYMEVT